MQRCSASVRELRGHVPLLRSKEAGAGTGSCDWGSLTPGWEGRGPVGRSATTMAIVDLLLHREEREPKERRKNK
jgi:hypothetical protein